MPRPSPLPRQLGNVSVSTKDGVFRARARLCLPGAFDEDTGKEAAGRILQLEARAGSEAAAVRALEAKVGPAVAKHLQVPRNNAAAIKETRHKATRRTVANAASDAVRDHLSDGEIAPSSAEVYQLHIHKHLLPSLLGQMSMMDVRAGDVDNYLRTISRSVGSASAKQGRAVLSKTFGAAVRQDLIPANPVRDAGPIRRAPSKHLTHLSHDRALSKEEREHLSLTVSSNKIAIDFDLVDLIKVGLVTGARIGELLALRWCDLETDQVQLTATISRIKGEGLSRNKPKTEYSARTIPVSPTTAFLLAQRAIAFDASPDDTRPVFPAPGVKSGAAWRDRSNTSKKLRTVFDQAGYPWLSFHGLRRSAITLIADTMPIRMAADFAGHTSTRTTIQDYLGRGKVSVKVADLL